MTVVAALQKCTLFKDFSDNGLQILSTAISEKNLADGATIFAEGSPGDALYVVKSGHVRITQKSGGSERELGHLGPGDAFGILAVLSPSVRLVSAYAVGGCELLEMSHKPYSVLHPHKPQACLKLALAIASELSKGASQVKGLTAPEIR
jgi:CRP/FNR family transcriptional regulator, cyclic AMP receptor protein